MSCVDLTKGLVANTCEQPIGGSNGRVILMNFDDIDRAALTVASGQCTALSLKSGKKGYAFTGKDDANIGSFTYSKGKYFGSYEHKITLSDFVGGAEAYEFVHQVANARLVALVQNRDIGVAGAKKYTLYGLEAGLVMNADSGTTEMTDSVIGAIELTSSENSKEPNRPINLYKTDEATTDTLVEGLIATTGA